MASMDMESSKHATPDTLLHKQKAQRKKTTIHIFDPPEEASQRT